MNTAVGNCLNKAVYSEPEVRRLRPLLNKGKFYKCPLCNQYHMTSKGARRGR